MNRRRTELLLIAFALLVTLAANAAVDAAYFDGVTAAAVTSTAALAVMFAVAHVAVRLLAPAADPLLLPCAALLNGIGLMFQRRLDLGAAERAKQLGNPAPGGHANQQLLWTLVGIALFVALLLVVRDHRLLDRFRYTLVAIGLFLLLLPSVLPARFSEVNGAKIWIRFAGFSIQPSEFAKICLIVFFASYFVAKRELLALATRRVAGLNLPRARDLGPVLLAWAASLAVLVREKDLGSSLLFFGIFVVMLYVATERTSWLLIGLGLFAGGAVMAHKLFGHVRARVDIWLDPFQDTARRGYQLTQGLFGLATGGLTGTGLGNGRPETVPYAGTDFIFATIGEELGLVGVVAVLTVFALFVARGLRVALGCRDDFGKLLATGLSFSVALQVFVVVGGVTRLIPLTGITLPFLSYGGSSLVANYVIVALLLRISDADRSPVERTPDVADTELTGEMTQVVVMR